MNNPGKDLVQRYIPNKCTLVLPRFDKKIDCWIECKRNTINRNWPFERLIIYVYNIWCRNKHIWELISQNVILLSLILACNHSATQNIATSTEGAFIILNNNCSLPPVLIAVTKMRTALSVIWLHGRSIVSLNFRINRSEISAINRCQLSV